VTHPEMQRYFMTIPEAAVWSSQASAMGRGGEIFVLDMASRCSSWATWRGGISG